MASNPGGRLPHATTHSASAAVAITSEARRANSAGVTMGPGSLIFVTVPSGSARVMLERVCPAIGTVIGSTLLPAAGAPTVARCHRLRKAPDVRPPRSRGEPTIDTLAPGSTWDLVAQMTTLVATARSPLYGRGLIQRQRHDHARTILTSVDGRATTNRHTLRITRPRLIGPEVGRPRRGPVVGGRTDVVTAPAGNPWHRAPAVRWCP